MYRVSQRLFQLSHRLWSHPTCWRYINKIIIIIIIIIIIPEKKYKKCAM